METNLSWEGKNSEFTRTSLPFQPAESLTENRLLKQSRLDAWTEGVTWPDNYPKDWENKLVWGDNAYTIGSLLQQGYAGEFDLIYIDPPFKTGDNFSAPVRVGEGDEKAEKDRSILEELAYRDTWGERPASYFQMIYERVSLIRDLLADHGLLYVHSDPTTVSHYVKLILDEVFGPENFRNEIAWCYTSPSHQSSDFPDKHDVILRYSKTDDYRFFPDKVRIPYEKRDTGKTQGIFEGRAVLPEDGKIPEDWWDDITPVARLHATELLDFPTQKPEELVERLLLSSTEQSDLVGDFFCGSGTTAAAAEKLGRRWIVSDLSKYAIHTTRKRLLNLHEYSNDYDEPCRPFVIYNLGNYQKHKFMENGHETVEAYRKFILDLFGAEPIDGYYFIHGRTKGGFVHISPVDSVVTVEEIKDTIQELTNEVGGSTLDVLGWDFELGIDQHVSEIEETYGIEIRLKQIPQEAAEIEQPGQATKIRFFDRNHVDLSLSVDGETVTVSLEDFVLGNPELVDADFRQKVEKSSDWIDYWAIDFDYQGDIFHNMWQDFRTRNDRELEFSATYAYDVPGPKSLLVKVIDVFGNDTNEMLEVTI